MNESGLPEKLIAHRNKSQEERWKEAMEWWKSQKDTIQQFIRSTAEASLVKDLRNSGSSGQGISSSDINHRVYSMYHEYLYYPEGTNVLRYLLDYSQE